MSWQPHCAWRWSSAQVEGASNDIGMMCISSTLAGMGSCTPTLAAGRPLAFDDAPTRMRSAHGPSLRSYRRGTAGRQQQAAAVAGGAVPPEGRERQQQEPVSRLQATATTWGKGRHVRLHAAIMLLWHTMWQLMLAGHCRQRSARASTKQEVCKNKAGITRHTTFAIAIECLTPQRDWRRQSALYQS